jgi:hypothetical protein
VPTISGFGSEWDPQRGQTKFWVELDNGAGYAGYGDRLPTARLDLHDQLQEIGLPLAQLGPYGQEIAGDLEAWTRLLARFPGGQAARPAYDYTSVMRHGAPITVEFAEGPSHGTVAVEQAGVLALASGSVYAGDPFGPREEAFVRCVQPGWYPVFVSWAEIEGEPRRRSVVAWLQFSDQPVTRWEQALTVEQDVASLEPGQMFGCPVDSGCACFADPGADRSEDELDGNIEESACVGDHLVAFTSGWGDGHYACFWGLDPRGEPSVLLLDAELIAF